MQPSDRHQRTLHYYNVPKSVTEQQLRKVFERVGHVIGFRFNIGTKGGPLATNWGYVDFIDRRTALEAMRQLDHYQFGDKKMRVQTREHKQKRDERRRGDYVARDDDTHYLEFGAMGTDHDVKKALTTVPVSTAYEAMEQLRVLAMEQPEIAAQLLEENPQLVHASVLILQHAGRLPIDLPAEAFATEVQPAAGSSSGQQAQQPVAPSATASSAEADAQLMATIENLGEEEVEQILNMTQEQLDAMEPGVKAQISTLQQKLKELVAGLEQ